MDNFFDIKGRPLRGRPKDRLRLIHRASEDVEAGDADKDLMVLVVNVQSLSTASGAILFFIRHTSPPKTLKVSETGMAVKDSKTARRRLEVLNYS